ncbi:histidine phosphatase family protein [Haematomicrobium sanguinis]|uniref:histidine phosphatase family protein n=1 Tax=Haematomicrobium sanguinis TaxID=479106 RepID=UPI00047ECAD0|nr:histidine phosphatase family protein [Haematomicrobium sanguinis]
MSELANVFLVRHGESEANIDTDIYERVPDYRIPLTDAGAAQARDAGEVLRAQLDGSAGVDGATGAVRVYVSPYLRAHQTLAGLDIGDRAERVIEEPKLREQDWANFQDPSNIEAQKKLRNAYGHFFYRFRDGESGADVYDRVSSFIDQLQRGLTNGTVPRNVVLVTHGLTMRLFCMRWFGWTVEYFESLNNPSNGAVKRLFGEPGAPGHLWEMEEPFTQWESAEPGTTILDRIG